MGVGTIADALRLYLSSWDHLLIKRGVGTLFAHYDIYRGADASLAETAEEIEAFKDRYFKAATFKIRGNRLELVLHREIGHDEFGARVVGDTPTSPYKWDLADPDSIESCIKKLHWHLKRLGYPNERPAL